MKKKFLFYILVLLISSTSNAQDLGYNSVDIGGDYQWNPDASTYSLQVASNAKIHHSVLFRAGYTKIQSDPNTADNNESGSGWSASIGYRYYIGIIPKGFYLGARIEVSDLKINWSNLIGGGTTKTLSLQPSLETGYTFLINDLFFITPNIAAGYQTNLKTNGVAVSYGNGFVPIAGISAGFRF